jgi:hypothetical protein
MRDSVANSFICSLNQRPGQDSKESAVCRENMAGPPFGGAFAGAIPADLTSEEIAKWPDLPELVEIVRAWPGLPNHHRSAILSFVRDAGAATTGE